MNTELLSVNGRIVSKKVFEIGQEMGRVTCDPLARDSKYECKTYDDEYGIEHLVLVQYDPNIVSGKVKGLLVGSFIKNNKGYYVALMEDATYCVVNNHFNSKYFTQCSKKVKDMRITSVKNEIKVFCKPLYSTKIVELKLLEAVTTPARDVVS